MKKLLYILLTMLLPFLAMAQFPQKQPLGTNKTLVYSKGGIGADSTVVIQYSYSDTAAANLGLVKNIPGALIRVGNNIYMRNLSATFWRLMSSLNSPASFRLSPTLWSTPVLAGFDPDTGEPYYEDSLHHLNEIDPWPVNTVLGRLAGVYGPIGFNLQNLLDVNGDLNKRNRILGNGYMLHYDSMGIKINQKAAVSGGNDTLFSVILGANTTTPLFNILASTGVRVGTNLYVANDFVVNTATGLSLTNGRNITIAVGSKYRSYQQPEVHERNYAGVPVFAGVNYGGWNTNDTINGSVYPFPDSANYIIWAYRWRNHDNYESDKFRFYADGNFYRQYLSLISSPTTADTLLIRGHDGKDKGITISTLSGLIGGGGGGGGITSFNNVGSSPNAAGASVSGSAATLQPADATNPGVLTAGTQSIGGAKTFASNSTQFTPGTNNESVVRVNTSAGTPVFQVGPYTSNSAFVGLWGGNITPGSANFFIQANDQSSRFRAAGSDRITINSTGTGINTTSPETVLDVNGEVQLRSVANASVTDSSIYIEDGKLKRGASNAHVHSASDITSGTLSMARLDTTNGVTSKASRDKYKDSINALKSPITLTDGATITQISYNARVISGGNRTWAITSPENGQTYTMNYIQDGTGGRKFTGPDGSNILVNLSANDSTLVVAHRQNNGWIVSSANYKNTGEYTPTIVNNPSGYFSNVSSSTGYLTTWERNGDWVQLDGTMDVVYTSASTISAVAIPLPPGFESNFTSFEQVHGIATAGSAGDNGTGLPTYIKIEADASNDRINLGFQSQSGSVVTYRITFHIKYKLL